MERVVIGVDPHKLSATIEVVDHQEKLLGSGRFTTDKAGYAAMRKYAKTWPERVWAVEGSNGTGRPLAQRLLEDGEQVVDVPAKLAARVRLFDTGHNRKTDARDAHSVAIVAVRTETLRVLQLDGELEALRLLCDRREALTRRRVQTVDRLQALLAELLPGQVKRDITTGQAKTMLFLERLPDVRKTLATDVQAAYDGDPACKSLDEVIFCYPGLEAITVYRLAHVLYELDIPFIPRMMTGWAHSRTGIDIHPGAKIGRHFFIDHGTGVVIGETTDIGEHVKLYQGVTLGALSFATDVEGNLVRGHKRHPTIEDRVVIYASATILGGKTVIGHDSVIGSSVWLTHSVEPHTTVTMEKPRLRIRAEVPDELKPELNYSI